MIKKLTEKLIKAIEDEKLIINEANYYTPEGIIAQGITDINCEKNIFKGIFKIKYESNEALEIKIDYLTTNIQIPLLKNDIIIPTTEELFYAAYNAYNNNISIINLINSNID